MIKPISILFLFLIIKSASCQDTISRRGTFTIAGQGLVICSEEKERDTVTITQLVKDPVLSVDGCPNCHVISFNYNEVANGVTRTRTVNGEHFPKDFIIGLADHPSYMPIIIQNVFYYQPDDANMHMMHGIPLYVK